MAEEKAVQRPRAPIDKMLAALREMDDETLQGAQYVFRGFLAARLGLLKPKKNNAQQPILELGERAAEDE